MAQRETSTTDHPRVISQGGGIGHLIPRKHVDDLVESAGQTFDYCDNFGLRNGCALPDDVPDAWHPGKPNVR